MMSKMICYSALWDYTHQEEKLKDHNFKFELYWNSQSRYLDNCEVSKEFAMLIIFCRHQVHMQGKYFSA